MGELVEERKQELFEIIRQEQANRVCKDSSGDCFNYSRKPEINGAPQGVQNCLHESLELRVQELKEELVEVLQQLKASPVIKDRAHHWSFD
jgi:ribosomal protein L29